VTPESKKAVYGGIAALLLTVGIARFAYTPLLPAMQAGVAGFGDAEGGLLAAANYLGYLAGAAMAATLSDIVTKDRLYRWALPLAVVSTAGMALTTDPILWALLRLVSGLASAAGLILCSGLVMHFLLGRGERVRMGLYFGGVGLGLALSAALVALLAPWLGWRGQWTVLGLAGLPLAWLAHRWVPRAEAAPATSGGKGVPVADPHRGFIRSLQAAYFCAGFGYVISATFLVDMLEGTPGLEPVAPWAWLLVGLAAAPSCLVWERIGERIAPIPALSTAWLVQVAGILLPVLHPSAVAALAGALLFGFTFMGIVALMLTLVGRLYPENPARPMGRLTFWFGTAQIIGPALGGWMAESAGSYTGATLLAAAVLASGLVPLARLLRRGGRLPEPLAERV